MAEAQPSFAGGPDPPPELRVGIVGTGAVAKALSAALLDLDTAAPAGGGCELAIWGRDAAAAGTIARDLGCRHAYGLADLAGSDVVLIAVSDGAIADVALGLAEALTAEESLPVLLHTSGALNGAAAMPGERLEAFVRGSMHPLVAVAPATRSFVGQPFAIEADGQEGVSVASLLITRLGGFVLAMPAPTGEPARTKMAYHALATMVATGVVALVERAAAAMEAEGGDRDAFRRAFAMLARSAADNMEAMPGAEALTGVVARRDEFMRELHRRALRAPRELSLYAQVTAEAEAMLQDEERRGQGQ